MADPDPGSTPEPTTDTTSDTTDEPLGDKGLRALQAEKDRRRAAVQRAEAAEARVTELETATMRSEIAASKGIPADLLTGSTKAELEAHADKLLAFRGDTEPKPTPNLGKPKEKLRGGATPANQDDVIDMGKVADKILHRGL